MEAINRLGDFEGVTNHVSKRRVHVCEQRHCRNTRPVPSCDLWKEQRENMLREIYKALRNTTQMNEDSKQNEAFRQLN